MDTKKWADDTIHHLRRVAAEARSLSVNPSLAQGDKQSSATPATQSGINGAAIAQALADFCRNNNSITQTLAIRLRDLADRYKQRAA